MAKLPSYREIADLIKKGATIEAQEKIMGLRETILTLQEENISLKAKVKELKSKIELSKKLTFKDSLYYADEDAIPFCPRCWETEQMAIHLKGPDEVEGYRVFDCPKCGEKFSRGKRPPSIGSIKMSR